MRSEMIRNEIADPRTFIKPIPLQLPSHKGVKIQARSFNVYNATIPLRDEIRKENYNRRKDQLSSMGFKTPVNMPYKVLGEPLFLNYKSAALHAVGQYETDEKENMVKESQNMNLNSNKAQTTQKANTKQTFSFRNYKKNKELLSLNDEVNRTKYFIHRVKLGHSLFDLLKNEEEKRNKKASSETKSIQMSIRPMKDSDDEFEQESEEELIDSYNEHQHHNQNYASSEQAESAHNSFANNRSNLVTPFNSENNNSALNNYDRVSKSRLALRDDINVSKISNSNSNRPQTYPANGIYTSIMSSYRQKSSIKKAKEETKPYAPVYSSLLSKDEAYLMDKPTLTRQLCILIWLLESINAEPNTISPLNTCFSINELGGEKLSYKEIKMKNEIEKRYQDFIKEDKKKDENKRDKEKNRYRAKRSRAKNEIDQVAQEQDLILNIENLNEEDTDQFKENQKNLDDMSALFDSSFADEDLKQPTKKFNLADITLTLMNMPEGAREKISSGQNLDNDHLESTRVSISLSNLDLMATNREFLNPNTINENSAFVTGQTDPKRLLQYKSSITTNTANLRQKRFSKKRESTVLNKIQKPVQTIADHELELIKIGNVEEMERIFNKTVSTHERRNSKSLKATTGPIRALWTEKVIDFQNNASSIKKYERLMEIKKHFENLMDENRIDVHQRIEELVKKRMTTCSIKYSNMNLNEPGLHNMLNRMNRSVIDYYKYEDMKVTPDPKYYEWFTELESLIENYYNRNDFILGKLLDKLAIYGKLNSKKQNELAFFRVLETLEIWELLSPDVMSSVEFCREKILEIQVEEFENWFKTKHPEHFVSRLPASASQASNTNKNEDNKDKK
ncbi:unnamed protein product [Brachionus calyciflorus]|uniref:Coiled-coil domain-containing protein n=1 Tax=Brachionus calyciflorus TaxID=104777 RepID=A0A813NIS6_9BILA|nr:unnamed protein product [Brachionus calyciflorus]